MRPVGIAGTTGAQWEPGEFRPDRKVPRMRVIDVEGLGYDAVVVTINGDERLLLIESTLDVDTRIEMMTEAMVAVD
jgi:hypothetical protein